MASFHPILPLPSQAYLKERLDYNPETGIFIWKFRPKSPDVPPSWNSKHAGKEPPTKNEYGYKFIGICGKRFLAHRLAWMYHYGIDPGEKVIDHINMITGDNRIANLRIGDESENRCNENKTRGQNPYKGVHTDPRGNGKNWYYMIGKKGRKSIIKYGFKTPEEARDARNLMVESIHGEFTRLG